MRQSPKLPPQAERLLRWPLLLTHLGVFAERAHRAFWPLYSILFFLLALQMFGLPLRAPVEMFWAGALLAVLALGWALLRGGRRFRWPGRADALAHLDASLVHRPLSGLSDSMAIGAADAASVVVWQAHHDRLMAQLKGAAPARPDLRIAGDDPFALRYLALVAFVMALLFGNGLRLNDLQGLAPGVGQVNAANGPSWEGWLTPPSYTGLPTLYLADITDGKVRVPVGSTLMLRLYGSAGALSVHQDLTKFDQDDSGAEQQNYLIARQGTLDITGAGGARFEVAVIDDMPPQVWISGEITRAADGEMRQPFSASDDYGIKSGQAEITLDLARVKRVYGYAVAPDPRETIVLDLPMTIAGDRRDFTEMLVDNLSEHPWAGLPVKVQLSVLDAAAQQGRAAPVSVDLPGRRFFDPMAAALIEERRELLWSRTNGARVAQILRAVTWRPEDVFEDSSNYLTVRSVIRRLELALDTGPLSPSEVGDIAAALWEVAVLLEDGTLENALARLRQAQERLSEAIRKGASDEEIAALMQELNEALDNYMARLAQESPPGDPSQSSENSMDITGDQLQQLLDRLQQLMEQGRRAEAQALLEQLRQMMENMQVTQGENGRQTPGQRSLEQLGDTLEEQRQLNDETFGDLQQQFDQALRPPGSSGENGDPSGQPPTSEQNPGQNTGPGQPGPQGQQPQQGDDLADTLADRQRALADEVARQQRNLPGSGSEEGDAARDMLDQAMRSMDEAADALKDEDFATALDRQADAMEALRQGMRDLSDQLARDEDGQSDQQGSADARSRDGQRRDPLGRETGANGMVGSEGDLAVGDDVYRRARDLLDEIRKRSGEQSRPELELEYLKRLLDRF
jgi:uncharacterized protein (TIGR02302 family)